MSYEIGYMCGVDFQHELELADSTKIYSSIEALKDAKKCWDSCGIVKVKIEIQEWVVEQDFEKGIKDEKY